MVLGLYPFTDIDADGAPRLDTVAGEELVRVERAAALALGHRAPEPPGALFLTCRRVIWIGEGGKGYAVDFIAVSLHAVSRDLEAYPSPCIYTQIETEGGFDEESDESDSEINGEIELSKVTEMRIIPSDPGQCILFVVDLDGLFESFSHCAELNPDPNSGSNGKVINICTGIHFLLSSPLFEMFSFHGFSQSSESDEENGWVHGDEDMMDGRHSFCTSASIFLPNFDCNICVYFLHSGSDTVDVNPIGQGDDNNITHAVVEVSIVFQYCGTFHSSF
ncbi:hypothetical protein HU200_060166 [Digitaria exilis]|uniref:Chloride conductance regulatory protein ICln n=1 Tax=Digitaria exilis TaxID=1010633 RepID=A0A835AF40_9POAL|nr:hypothetical protein HU200_060166 [Digitaria exilis]